MIERYRPYLVLFLLWALYFHPLLLHPTQVLYTDYSDYVAEHLPAKIFLNRHWQATGELPLWNPYHFCGTPFVHDIQVGIFYPPYAVTYFVPDAVLGAALSWVIVLHVLAAGIFMYVYTRWRGLSEVGGLVAAVGFMLSAKWMTNLLLAGHTITVGLAWLPLVLLGLEAGVRFGRVWPLVGAGVAFALLVLGTHPQWTLYANIFIALWALGPVLERAGYLGGDGPRSVGRTLRELARWAACGLVIGVVAGPLTAVQILPTLEAAGQSSRTAAADRKDQMLVDVLVLFGMVGPMPVYDPPFVGWEQRGLLGIFWLGAAFAAPVVVGRRAYWPTVVLVGLLLFSVAGAALSGWVPGLGVFRLPSRMLLNAVFPVVFLAATVTDAAIQTGWHPDTRRVLRRTTLIILLVTALPTLTCIGLQQFTGKASRPVWTSFLVYWGAIGLAIPAFLWLTLATTVPAAVRTGVWLVILLAELVTPLPPTEVRPQERIYPDSPMVEMLRVRAKLGEGRALDWYLPEFDKPASAIGIGAPLALTHEFETVKGYNPLDVRHYREYVWAMAGMEGGVTALNPATLPTLPNMESKYRAMFDMLGIRVLVAQEGDRDPLTLAPWKLVGVDPAPVPVPVRPPIVPDQLRPHVVYENPAAYPRVWVVPEARAMPPGREFPALRSCDFRQVVLLATTDSLPPRLTESVGQAVVTEYQPDRVAVRLDNTTGGFLVLADVWFPGWVCRVDGQEVPIYRANHAFRAIALPAGAREAVFTFEPRSYRIGWWISAVATALLLVVGAIWLAVALLGRNRPQPAVLGV